MKITIKGQQLPVESNSNLEQGLIQKQEFVITGSSRGLSDTFEIELDKDDVVELEFDDKTKWLCGSDSLGDLFPEQMETQNRSGEATFAIPTTLSGPAGERSLGGTVALKMLKIFGKKAIDGKVKTIAASFEEHELKVKESTLFRLDRTFGVQPFVKSVSAKPYLLFLHGTASSTDGSFGGLVPQNGTTDETGIWRYITQTYGDNVIAFQHRTLTESPIKNVLDLVKQLPDSVDLHLISHSRGGLVGDVLSRFCIADQANMGFSQVEIEVLKDKGHDDDVKYIESIRKIIETKRIFIKKFVRVACPAAGTTLASKRLDHLFNMIGNLTGYVTASSLFRELIAALINSKNNINVLPGLEAMDPDSPLIKVINDKSFPTPIATGLIVIAGNCKVDVSVKALGVIASKLFFMRDNDLIVNTGSMYQGARRAGDIQYYFDQGTDVDHFNYFKNKRTQNVLMAALKSDNTAIAGFEAMSPAVAAAQRNAVLGLDGGKLFMNKVTGKRPIAVMMPGIMGSNLDVSGDSVWINYLRFLTGGLDRLKIGAQEVEATSIVGTSYRKLANFLSDNYDVVTFPFDWRLTLAEAAKTFNSRITELMKYNQPIKIVAHSMGGVLFRNFIVDFTDTWERLNRTPDFRLLFLGAPLGGSFRIPAVLFGKDDIIDKLSKIDLRHDKNDLVGIFCQLSGLLDLLPFTEDAEQDMGQPATWDKMKQALGDNSWNLPDPTLLKEFRTYRAKIKAKLGNIDYTNAVYIAGKDKSTPCGFKIEQKVAGKELVFLSTGEGDQSVTWESGIPQQMIQKDLVYYVCASHGELANTASIFGGIADILSKGRTQVLSRQRPVVRGTEKLFRSPEVHDFDFSEAGVENTILGLSGATTAGESDTTLSVSISNGELRFASYPVLAGHFCGDAILNAEKEIDKQLSGLLSRRHKLGLYPGPVQTSEVLNATGGDFKGAIIVGLGETGKLTVSELKRTVEQGIINYLLTTNNRSESAADSQKAPGISSLAIASGYGGLTIEGSVRAILEGIQHANRKIVQIHGVGAQVIKNVEFIEKYEDSALNCFYAVSRLQKQRTGGLNISLENNKIRTLIGLQRRLPAEQSQQWWNRINIQSEYADGEHKKVKSLSFSASTGAAREERRSLQTNMDIISTLIKDISVNDQWSEKTARTIFELLIPLDFKDQFKKQGKLNLILDKDSAAYPWELLHDGVAESAPLAVSSGIIRQLATDNFRMKVNAVEKSTALVIADPDLCGFITQLDGARREGEQVATQLEASDFTVNKCFPRSAFRNVIEELCTDEYKVLHLAGHGVFNEKDPDASGMVIGNGIFLSTKEIAQMSSVPELVFVNCCFLGQMNSDAEKSSRNQYRLAANIGTQLIENGVKAVIVAGWAISDEAALEFSRVFYSQMLRGCNFGDAIQGARDYIYKQFPMTNTWGAYQCYGDPYYKLMDGHGYQKQSKRSFVTAMEAEVELYNLRNALEMNDWSQQECEQKLMDISDAVDKADIRNTVITEMEALIYAELGDYVRAINILQQSFRMAHAEFRFSSIEKFCNIRGIKCMLEYAGLVNNTLVADAQFAQAVAGMCAEMEGLVPDIRALISFGATAHRHALLGSAYKRTAVMQTDLHKKVAFLEQAAQGYFEARMHSPSVYFSTNWLQAEALLNLVYKTAPPVPPAAGAPDTELAMPREKRNIQAISATRAVIVEQRRGFTKAFRDMNYWDLVEKANIDLTLLLLDADTTDEKWNDLKKEYSAIMKIAGAPAKRITEQVHLNCIANMLYAFKPAVDSSILTEAMWKYEPDMNNCIMAIKGLLTAYSNSMSAFPVA